MEGLVLSQLRHILQVLGDCTEKMEKAVRPRARNILWRLFFPAGEFMVQKSLTSEAAKQLIEIDERLRDMVEVLEGQGHPLASEIEGLLYLDLVDMARKLIELPPRARYMRRQVEELAMKVEAIINRLEEDRQG